jgi:hypothetical protein
MRTRILEFSLGWKHSLGWSFARLRNLCCSNHRRELLRKSAADWTGGTREFGLSALPILVLKQQLSFLELIHS